MIRTGSKGKAPIRQKQRKKGGQVDEWGIISPEVSSYYVFVVFCLRPVLF